MGFNSGFKGLNIHLHMCVGERGAWGDDSFAVNNWVIWLCIWFIWNSAGLYSALGIWSRYCWFVLYILILLLCVCLFVCGLFYATFSIRRLYYLSWEGIEWRRINRRRSGRSRFWPHWASPRDFNTKKGVTSGEIYIFENCFQLFLGIVLKALYDYKWWKCKVLS